MFDLVVPQFRAQWNEFVFAMFGRAHLPGANNQLAKFLHEHFAATLRKQLTEQSKLDGIPDALRRAFLALEKHLHRYLNPLIGRKGSVASAITASAWGPGGSKDDQVLVGSASSIAVYIIDRIMSFANVGNALPVVSRTRQAMPVSKQHDPWDWDEAARIRSAEGWISPAGLTNGEIDLSRSFGYYKLAPMINCCPAIHVHELDETDDFLIIVNRGLFKPQGAGTRARRCPSWRRCTARSRRSRAWATPSSTGSSPRSRRRRVTCRSCSRTSATRRCCGRRTVRCRLRTRSITACSGASCGYARATRSRPKVTRSCARSRTSSQYCAGVCVGRSSC
jgi:serine/threonine protein phosphatase PrpC